MIELTLDLSVAAFSKRRLKTLIKACVLATLISAAFAVLPGALPAQTQSTPLTTWTVTIVLPPKIVAGQPATLAVLGVDGRLASGVNVDLGDGLHVTTDRTGRASFIAPASRGFLLAKGSGSFVATLVDPQLAGGAQPVAVAPVVALRDRFSICGPGLRGDADANRVQINNEPVLVLASSPECIVVLARPTATPGPAVISVESPDAQWNAKTTLVALEFEAPVPALVPDKKSSLVFRVRGSDQKLGIAVENQTPGVLRFMRGNEQELLTAGGSGNTAALTVLSIRSGDYSFRTRLLPTPDTAAAQRYLDAAQAIAPREVQGNIKSIATRLAHHPRDFEIVRAQLGQIVGNTIAGDFRTLIDAAREAL